MNERLCELTAVELAGKFRSRIATPLDAVEAALARIEQCNPVVNAIVTLDAAGARAAAAASTERWRSGNPLSLLDGVPVTIKDNVIVRGMRATWGSRVFADYVPDRDELPVARLRAAGLIIVGKTNVPEFTLHGYTDNLLFGATRNPWDPQLTPGGSSGGAVASVAAGMVPAAIGTDGGGSIRRPASHTGLAGFKPTVGRVARANGFPAILHDLEVVGPVARDTADLSALMRIMAGPDPRDPSSLAWPAWSETEVGDQHLRILYVPRFADAPVEPEIETSVREAAGAFAQLGHDVRTGEAPFDVEAGARAYGCIGAAGLAWLMRAHNERALSLTADVQIMLQEGTQLRAADYVEALAVADRLKRTTAEWFEQFDILMTPAAAALPWPIPEPYPAVIAGQPVGPRGHAVFTAFVNLAGCPGIALPCAPSRAGLPIGFQLIAARGKDELLLALARSYEAARPWRDRYHTLQTV